MKKFFKVLLLTFLILISSFAFVIVIINSTKFFIYKDYFTVAKELTVNEGLGDGYIPSGATKVTIKDHDIYLSAGYMSNNRPSRIYVIKPQKTYYVEILVNDFELSKAKLSGISATKDNVYISAEGNIYTLKLKDILAAEYDKLVDPEQNDVKITNTFKTGVAADAGIFTDISDQYLYVGEFYDENTKSNHETKVNDGKDSYYSYVEKYKISDVAFEKEAEPICKFAVRDLLKGFAISNDKILLSTSWGLSSSYFYSYSIPTEFDDKENKIYYLDDRYLEKTIKAPAMSGALDYDGKSFITLYRSASNKYFFGKFFFANKIVGISL